MTAVTEMTHAARKALAEAAAWRILGLMLERPREGWHGEIRALMAEFPDEAVRSLCESSLGATEGEYLAILGPGGIVSPREVAYRPMEDPGRIIADLQAFYLAFHFEPVIEEPLDHIAAEAGFVGYLKLKEAYALSQSDAEAAATVSSGIERFMAEHFGSFCRDFADRLHSQVGSYLNGIALHLATRTP